MRQTQRKIIGMTESSNRQDIRPLRFEYDFDLDFVDKILDRNFGTK